MAIAVMRIVDEARPQDGKNAMTPSAASLGAGRAALQASTSRKTSHRRLARRASMTLAGK
ncbi:MAG TPA: hypothetical protein VK876_00745 [Rubrivivax sp.]|nr:hypothetical protein [Rubrivivax sp.]